MGNLKISTAWSMELVQDMTQTNSSGPCYLLAQAETANTALTKRSIFSSCTPATLIRLSEII